MVLVIDNYDSFTYNLVQYLVHAQLAEILNEVVGERIVVGPGHRQLRFVHLQPRSVSRRAERGLASPSQRPDHARSNPRVEAGPDSYFARSLLAARIRTVK